MGLLVIEPGFWTSVQDAGRVGYREWGVSSGGAFDLGAADLANALVGNSFGRAVLELTLRGGTFEAHGTLGIALAGAPIEATVIGRQSAPRPIQVPASTTIHSGERLVLGRIHQGARAYLAVKNGFLTPARLGSRSTDQPLRPGELLETTESTVPTRHFIDPGWSDPGAQPLRILAGPDALVVSDQELWQQSGFRVGSRCNRIGLRLEGPDLKISPLPDRLSTPLAPGAIQVAGGQLILLGVGCGTMGGYPHVAHVISADIDRVGQLRPGAQIRFQQVDLKFARALDSAARQARRAQLVRVASLARDG
jgi:biotin-dependent carboxylase-like uncharacterized protein